MLLKARSAVVGGLVADSASVGLHWIYDAGKIKALVNGGQPEFFTPPSCPFYKLTPDVISPYGYEAWGLLEAIEATSWAGGDGTAATAFLVDWYKGNKGSTPPYVNHVNKNLIANVDAGKAWPDAADTEDQQAQPLVKAPIIVAKWAGSGELATKMDAAVRLENNNDFSAATGVAAALILEKVVLGSTVKQAVAWAAEPGNIDDGIRTQVEAAVKAAAEDTPFGDLAQGFGLSCKLPGAFEVSLACVLRYATFEEGVRANIMAAGDQCSRGVYIGALLGAQGGVPKEWEEKAPVLKAVELLLPKL